MITSVNNSQVKNVIQLNQKAKARRQQGLFTAEGRKMFREAPADWISRVYVAESLSEDEEILGKITEESLDYEIVADPVFRQMSDTQTPQGVLTVLKKPVYTEEALFRGEKPSWFWRIYRTREMWEPFSGQERAPVLQVFFSQRPA